MSNPRQAINASDRSRAVKFRNQLAQELASVLPKDFEFKAYHLSTTPAATEALCYPPALKSSADPKNPAEAQSRDRRPSKPLKTYCEKHFLAVSVEAPKNGGQSKRSEVLVLGLEIYIYTTAFNTTIFVAKADSTGYLHLLNLPKGASSPIREVTAVFLKFLVTSRRRNSKQLVVNLFARAQSQYLFPGSVKNSGKHVLDDRRLIKWWCRVLNPLVENDATTRKKQETWNRVHGYLIIPGLDNYETRAFLPRSSFNWTFDHPLEHISLYTKDASTFDREIPARCLIPTYPDDPKARFVQELEDSTSEKAKLVGGWKSPRTLEQFWEMMAFRQECSSGRMTGFIWVVFDPESTTTAPGGSASNERSSAAFMSTPNASFCAPAVETACPSTPVMSQHDIVSLVTPTSTPSKPATAAPGNQSRKQPTKKVLTGRILPRKPQIKRKHRTKFPKQIETPHYYWPEEGRGQVVLNESGYNRAIELLLHLDFGTLEQAVTSTARWTNEVNMSQDWALNVIGCREITSQPPSSSAGTVNNLSAMTRRKRPVAEASAGSSPAPVNVLGSGLVRKKAKLEAGDNPSTPATGGMPRSTDTEPRVNVLGAGLVRKKAKPC